MDTIQLLTTDGGELAQVQIDQTDPPYDIVIWHVHHCARNLDGTYQDTGDSVCVIPRTNP
jgi:hypothetical protein